MKTRRHGALVNCTTAALAVAACAETASGQFFSAQATGPYRARAVAAILAEANDVARILPLHEKLPIEPEQLAETFVSNAWDTRHDGRLGTISTTNYFYAISRGNRLCYIERNDQNKILTGYAVSNQWSLALIDTNAAYRLACDWLSAVKFDVAGLDRDLHLSVTTGYRYVPSARGKFSPIYDVSWSKPDKPPSYIITSDKRDWDPVVSVLIILPTRTLVSLRCEDAKYILRSPVIVP